MPTRSALMVALARAIGARESEARYRNPDFLAEKFFGPEEKELMAGLPILDQFSTGPNPPMAENAAALLHMLRAVWCDQEMLAGVAAGARQVVILGAGLDTRLYRFAGQLGGLRCFEVDLPWTQQYKKRKIGEILGGLPEAITYVPIDFNRQSLVDVLAAAGWKRNERTFFLWEGVAPYLEEEAVKSVLGLVASCGPGSRICFDYLEPYLAAGQHTDELLKKYVQLLESWGERFTFSLDDLFLEAYLREQALRLRTDVTIGEICARFFPEICVAHLGAGRSGYHFCTAEAG